MSELVQRGEELLRAGLASPSATGPKLYDAIGAQLCDRGMEAPARATRSEVTATALTDTHRQHRPTSRCHRSTGEVPVPVQIRCRPQTGSWVFST